MLTPDVADLSGNKLPGGFAWNLRVGTETFWARSSDGLWDEPSNWSTGIVPRSNENVVIDVPVEVITVTHQGGLSTIQSLICYGGLIIDGGALHIVSAHQVSGNVSLNGGTL